MTQEYTPIELNDDTPEPKDEGIYFLYSPSIAPDLVSIYHSSEGWELPGGPERPLMWPELIKGRNKDEKITIQSLADHDAQIRADAWEEGRIAEHDEANGWGDAINPYRKEQK